MRTVGPVDREYVLFNKNIIIGYFQNDIFFLKHSVPQGAITVVILF